jgi:hypothetical protein
VKVHEETIGMASELQPGLFQTKFHEDTGDYQLLGGGNVIGTKRTTHTESGSCKPAASTTGPESKYTAMFGYFITGKVEPSAASFSGSMMMPSANKGTCTWTWSFARAQ